MVIGLLGAAPATQPMPEGALIETIVLVRHGEKIEEGSGQLSPQGFNRAIALSDVLLKKFGKPTSIFAPDPSETHKEKTGDENYVRPLATIEPTAIKLGLPVKTPCGYRESDKLAAELCKPQYAAGTIFIAWEHKQIPEIAMDVIKHFDGDPTLVPTWDKTDFDSIYVVKIDQSNGHPAQHPTVMFVHDHEGLDDQSTEMPKPAAR